MTFGARRSGIVLVVVGTTFAPRLSPRVLDLIVRLDDRSVPIAEVNRRVGREAQQLGYVKPSYQRVRVLVHLARRIRRRRRSTAAVVAEVAVRARPPEALWEHLHDPYVTPPDERAGLRGFSARPP